MNRNILILGDSYSTFEGYVPEGYAYYYPCRRPGGVDDVNDVSDTWWYPCMKETGDRIVLNNSWSGSTICYTAYEGRDCSETSSFITRTERLIREGFFEKNKIDIMLIFGGTNDSWANSPLGSLKYSDFRREDLYSVLPAISYLLKTAKEQVGAERILYVINSRIKEEIINGAIEACGHYGVEYLLIADETDKIMGHPTKKGMAEIKEQIKEVLLNK